MQIENQQIKSKPVIGVLCFVVIAIFAAILIIPASREVFKSLSGGHPLPMGFIKFAFLATTGELIAARFTKKVWTLPHYFPWRMLVWGCLGVVIALMFKLFGGGAQAVIDLGVLPGKGVPFLHALYASVLMNITFGPVMMGFHRMIDGYLDLRYEAKGPVGGLTKVIDSTDWQTYVKFVLLKTVPIFWFPAHTITFLLPPEYQVIVAAFLSIALGIILSLKKN